MEVSSRGSAVVGRERERRKVQGWGGDREKGGGGLALCSAWANA